MFDVMIVNPSTLCLLSRRAYPTSLLQQVVLYVLLACTIHLYVLFYFYFLFCTSFIFVCFLICTSFYSSFIASIVFAGSEVPA